MANTRAIKGTFRITVHEENGAAHEIAALRGATLNISRQTLPAANPDSYGSDYFITGTYSWSGSAEYHQVRAAGTLTQVQALRRLEVAMLEGQIVVVKFENPFETPFSGEAILTRQNMGGSFADAFGSQIELQGRGELLRGLPVIPVNLAVTSSSTLGITITWD